jgi:amphi-Trp domain-containing protein
MELELKERSTMAREDAAARLRAIADELASGNDIILERGEARFVAKVPDEVALKIEFEVEEDKTEFECGVSEPLIEIKRAVLQHQHDDVVNLPQVREPTVFSHDKLPNVGVHPTAAGDPRGRFTPRRPILYARVVSLARIRTSSAASRSRSMAR